MLFKNSEKEGTPIPRAEVVAAINQRLAGGSKGKAGVVG